MQLVGGGGELAQEMFTNPWRELIPTVTSNSVIVGRKLHADGTLQMRRIMPLELFRVMGWDLEMWSDMQSPYVQEACDDDFMMDLCGNGWSGFSFLPVFMAAIGCLNWAEVAAVAAEKSIDKDKDKDNTDDDDDDEGDVGSQSLPSDLDG